MSYTNLPELKQALSQGIITKLGYTLHGIRLLEIEDIDNCPRAWIGDQLDMTTKAVTIAIGKLKASGLL